MTFNLAESSIEWPINLTEPSTDNFYSTYVAELYTGWVLT